MAQTSSNFNPSAPSNQANLGGPGYRKEMPKTTTASPIRMNFNPLGGAQPLNLMPNQMIAGASSIKQGMPSST